MTRLVSCLQTGLNVSADIQTKEAEKSRSANNGKTGNLRKTGRKQRGRDNVPFLSRLPSFSFPPLSRAGHTKSMIAT
jgi:hypothetical protein